LQKIGPDLRSCPDPQHLYRNALGLTVVDRKSFCFRDDIGCYDKDGVVISTETLSMDSSAFQPGTAVIADVNLRYFKVDTGKTFQLYFTTLQSLGPAFPLDYMPPTEPLPASESGPVLQSSPIKRQASTVFSMNPSPKKKPILRTASMGLLSILPLTPLGSMSLTSAATSPAASIQEDMEV